MCRLAAAALAAISVFAQDPRDKRIEELETRVRMLEERLRALESARAPERRAPAAVAPATVAVEPAAAESRSPISGYMDFHYNKDRGEQSPGRLDFHRFVLLFGHNFTDRIKFWSELEIEHAFVEGREEKGELELEQAYLDFLVKPWLNFRGGMMLAPVGLINERHEPPSFNGVERPFVDTVIVPSTWFDGGAGVFGDLGKGFAYKLYAMAPLDATGFSAEEGLREGRQKGFQSITERPAFTGRLEFRGLPRLSLGASFWRGRTGFDLLTVNPRVRVFEFDGRFSHWRLDFRGQFARAGVSDAGALNLALQRRTGVNPNIARAMRGFYWESAARVLPRRFPHDLALFWRYENFDTQYRMPSGYLPLPQFDRAAHVMGITYYPEPDVSLKFDYTILRSRSALFPALHTVNLGMGWWF
ncbi:MAG: hypothetical protein ACRD44_13695 [Bryobacteraceae bacterium]